MWSEAGGSKQSTGHTVRPAPASYQVEHCDKGGEKACPAPVFPALRAYFGYVEQHTARTQSSAPRLPRPRETRVGATAPASLRRPESRLTALGTGLGLTAVTLAGGAVETLFAGEPGAFFGVWFVLACIAAAVFVRPYDLSAAPIAAPIAFAVTVVLTADSGEGGVAGHAMGAITALALLTGWLYAGTLCAAAIAAVRKVAYVRRQRRR